MIKKHQSTVNVINALSDAVLIFISVFLAMILRFRVLNGVLNISYRTGSFVFEAVIYSIFIILINYFLGMYKNTRYKSHGKDFLKIIVINLLGALILMSFFYVLRITDISRWALVFFWVISSALMIVKRLIGVVIIRKRREKGLDMTSAVVIGNGSMAHKFISNVNNNPQMGIKVEGYISGVQKEGLGDCLGSYEDLEKIIGEGRYDTLIIALEPHEYQWMEKVLDIAAKEGMPVEMIPFYNDSFPAHPSIENIGSTKIINMRATPLDNVGWRAVKRLGDIIISLILIIVTSPLMLITAIGVKLSSPGPVIFKQQRVGKDKKLFYMLKFRSMKINTSNTGWTTDNDDRRTKFGSFIRKVSLDELPQFFNVFAGQMSLVGPRPELPNFVSEFKESIPRYLVRQQIRPGITGWSQVNGLRGDTSIRKRVEFDIWYIENWTLGLDIKILFKTVFGGFVNQEKIG